MGMEEPIVNHYGNKFNPIGNLMAVRAEYGALTFGSTNQKWSSLEDHYSAYVGTRAKEHINFIHLPKGKPAGRLPRSESDINMRKKMEEA